MCRFNGASLIASWTTKFRARKKWMTSLHIFADQFWLEEEWDDKLRKELPNLLKFKITIRHRDWEPNQTPKFDAKQERYVRFNRCREAADDSEDNSWGRRFMPFEHLERLELELETMEPLKDMLDQNVARAVG